MNRRLLSLVLAVLAAFSLTACGVDAAAVSGDESGDEALSNDELALSRSGRFETFQGADGQYYFHLVAGNGEKVLQSEGYAGFSASQAGITAVQAHGVSEARYLLREARDGSYYFLLTSTNGQIIGMSEMYSSRSAAQGGVTATLNVVKKTVEQGPAAQGAIRFETFKGLDGRFYFHLKARNGQIILQSQAYATRTAANAGVASVKTNGANPARFEIREARDGKSYFVLKAANAQIIGMGEMYASVQGAQGGIAAVVSAIASMR
jgi:uncharacterized protein YegP (UPF0339 family)